MRLKKRKGAVLLVHNYQKPEIQQIADYIGDSLDLSKRAVRLKEKVIVFCGVKFMAESAKVLSPKKTVLLPRLDAGCPMADMITAEQLAQEKAKYPGAQVVCYVNSSAAVKAGSDICCTSANAVQVVQAIDKDRAILFVPDQYLGHYAMRKADREMHLWPGYCPTHMKIGINDVIDKRARYPQARVLVHPECRPEVIDAADEALSTGGIIRYARSYEGSTLIVGTETGILHRLRKENPAVEYVPVTKRGLCPNMKRITLEKVLWSMEAMKPEIEIPEDIRQRALTAVERMLKL